MDRRRILGLAASALIAPRAQAKPNTNRRRDFDMLVSDGPATTSTPGMSVAIVRRGVRFRAATAVLAFANIDDNHSFKPFQSELTFRLLDRANVA